MTLLQTKCCKLLGKVAGRQAGITLSSEHRFPERNKSYQCKRQNRCKTPANRHTHHPLTRPPARSDAAHVYVL